MYPRWERVWVVESIDGFARSAFFNIESARRWIEERSIPERWIISSYTFEKVEDDSYTPSLPGVNVLNGISI